MANRLVEITHLNLLDPTSAIGHNNAGDMLRKQNKTDAALGLCADLSLQAWGCNSPPSFGNGKWDSVVSSCDGGDASRWA
jgi:hypothetical protein